MSNTPLPSDVVEIDSFFTGCLWHFLGQNKKALEDFKESKGKEFEEHIKIISEYITKETEYNEIKEVEKRSKKEPEHLVNLGNIYADGKIENRKIIQYSNEDEFSRSKFQRDLKDFNNENVKGSFEAILFYVLRSHVTFYSKKSITKNGFGYSVKALNDLHQADALLKDLFFGFHGAQGFKGETFKRFVSNDIATPKKMNYGLLLCLLQFFIKVAKGNIYNELHFSEDALDYYSKALRFVERYFEIREIGITNDTEKDIQRIQPILGNTIVNTHFEMSKIFFDQGKIIYALEHQLTSIVFILLIALNESNKSNQEKDIISNAKQAIKRLEDIKNILKEMNFYFQEQLRRDMVLSLFIPHFSFNDDIVEVLPCSIIPEQARQYFEKGEVLFPLNLLRQKLQNFIPENLKSILADILARLGFIFWSIRIKFEDDKYKIKNRSNVDNMLERVITFKQQDKKILESIKSFLYGFDEYESELGIYTHNLIELSDNATTRRAVITSKQIERVFSSAYFSRPSNLSQPPDLLADFCNKLARHSLINVSTIASIPIKVSRYLGQEGYKQRHEKPFRNAVNKFVVLRRWQSFNPKVPRPTGQNIRGGGYFLFWEGKGLVIDPGYNFTQNFYEQGFSIEDIDSILVTHTHPDHDDELNTILTLVEEWNKLNEMRKDGSANTHQKHLDLFLNEGAYRKYNSWLHSKNIRIRKIFFLQSGMWSKTSETKNDIELRQFQDNPTIDLIENYEMKIEVVPAWHDELIDRHSSVGIVLKMYNLLECLKFSEDEFETIDYKELLKVIRERGLTKVLGIKQTEESESIEELICQLNSCLEQPSLIRSLEKAMGRNISQEEGTGDRHKSDYIGNLNVTTKEYRTKKWSELTSSQQKNIKRLNRYLLEDHFKGLMPRFRNKKLKPILSLGITGDTENYEGISDFYKDVDILVAHLGDIKFRELLSLSNMPDDISIILEELVNTWFKNEGLKSEDKTSIFYDYLIRQDLFGISDPKKPKSVQLKDLIKKLDEYENKCKAYHAQRTTRKEREVRQAIMGIVELFKEHCLPGKQSYVYHNHLGLKGVYSLHEALRNNKNGRDKLMIIGELPEELQSYRHIMACFLNALGGPESADKLRCLTGDIGLTIGLKTSGIVFGNEEDAKIKNLNFAIRCPKCFQNNEYVEGKRVLGDTSKISLPHYHASDNIQETPVKAMDSKIIWLCEKRHSSLPDYLRYWYFTEPVLDAIW